MRWGIETSFRELKYAIGLTSFHARKPDFIKQEIYARLLLYNYCELITTHVIKQMKNNDKTKQVNFTIAIYICREYLRNKRNLSPPDVINLIEKHRELMFILSEKHRQDNAPQGCTTILIGIMSTELTRIVCQILAEQDLIIRERMKTIWRNQQRLMKKEYVH